MRAPVDHDAAVGARALALANSPEQFIVLLRAELFTLLVSRVTVLPMRVSVDHDFAVGSRLLAPANPPEQFNLAQD